MPTLIAQDNNALTSSIAMEANRDGADMTAIQFVAMIFLPATFVCVSDSPNKDPRRRHMSNYT